MNGLGVQSSFGEGFREVALFAGSGGGILGGKLLGWRTICAVEINTFAASVLVARQNDLSLDAFPIWDDCRSFSGVDWRGITDVVSAGFPCQDISIAGNGEGIEGERSGLWKEAKRIIGEIRPPFVWLENVPALTFRGLGRVLGDLVEMGLDAKWGCVSAADSIWAKGTPTIDHLRNRIWIFGASTDVDAEGKSQSQGGEQNQRRGTGDLSDASSYASVIHGEGIVAEMPDSPRRQEPNERPIRPFHIPSSWWESESGMVRVADGIPNRVVRIESLGNAQCPATVELAWKILTKGM